MLAALTFAACALWIGTVLWAFIHAASLHDAGSDLTETHPSAVLEPGGSGSLADPHTAGSRVSDQPPHADSNTRKHG